MIFDRRTRLAGLFLAALSLVGCNSIRSMMDPGSIEYRGAGQGPKLDIPPDLVTPQGSERYTLPERGASSRTLSDFNRERAASDDAAPRGSVVMPVREGARIERDGEFRWVTVKQPPEKVWPVLEDFWASQGFTLAMDSPQTGIMETEWAERRQKVENSGVRGMLSSVLGSSYSTGERDRYRTRIDRMPDGSTEIFVSHRGMEEVVTGIQRDQSIWQARPTNPELEIEYLRRILVQFGTAREAITVAGAGSGASAPGGSVGSGSAASAASAARTRIVTQGDLSQLRVNEGFDRAWREVGIVLDRVGFTVEDRDRSKGTYYVRYVDLDRRDPRQGAISRFFSGERKDLMGQRYQIAIIRDTSDVTVAVRESDGAAPRTPETTRVANRIIALLHEEMK